ncbi:hypothetical protein, partial [Sphingobacterium sp. xlx-130]|uniref:hypothetical protein n=1 Tax=Sphingobacterium sp. xlx-130 TaxID=2654323 RepID=UPI00196A10A9
PIPNREVKPARADGIAVTGGRVGRCLFLHKAPSGNWRGFSCDIHLSPGYICYIFTPIATK